MKSNPCLMVVADYAYAGDEERWTEVLTDLNKVNISSNEILLQIRIKLGDRKEKRRLASIARHLISNNELPLILNGDFNLAKELEYDGCHQPERDLRPIPFNSDWIHSTAAHSEKALKKAEECNVDLVVYGPIYRPTWKDATAVGTKSLRCVSSYTSTPIFAIGGITSHRLPEIKDSGASGIAVLSGVMDSKEPMKTAMDLVNQWNIA